MKSEVNAIVNNGISNMQGTVVCVQVLIDKMTAANGEGLQCPWTGASPAVYCIWDPRELHESFSVVPLGYTHPR